MAETPERLRRMAANTEDGAFFVDIGMEVVQAGDLQALLTEAADEIDTLKNDANQTTEIRITARTRYHDWAQIGYVVSEDDLPQKLAALEFHREATQGTGTEYRLERRRVTPWEPFEPDPDVKPEWK